MKKFLCRYAWKKFTLYIMSDQKNKIKSRAAR